MTLGLATLHHHKIIHRDIKPNNIFILLTPFGELIQLGDFGTAKMLEKFDPLTQLMTKNKGTYVYFSPEKFDTDY
jgi:eukaryotic-like serine/threonine-protein kinase